VPNILVVTPSVEAKTVTDIVELAKKTPGGLDFASSGNGTLQHLCLELLKFMTKVPINHIPYRGGGLALNDVVAGQVKYFFSNGSSSIGDQSSLVTASVTNALEALIQDFPKGTFPIGATGTYSLSMVVAGYLIQLNASGVFTINIPTAASSGIPVGAVFTVMQYAPGSSMTLTLAGGVSILNNVALSSTSFTKYRFTHVATNVWTVDTILQTPTTVWMPLAGATFPSGGGGNSSGFGPRFTSTFGFLQVPLGPFDHGDEITRVSLVIKPASGHAGLPAVMPVAEVWAGNGVGTSVTQVAQTVDPSANVSAYDALHSIILNPFPSPFPCAATHFWLNLFNENSTNALAGLVAVSLSVDLNR